jgi:F-type H+-transporting ATPase subunit b
MATTAHTEVPHEKGTFPPFNATTFASQLVWLVIAFVCLYVLMSRIALPRIEKAIERRGNAIAGDLKEAERLKQQSEEAVAAYEKALADARSRAQAIANETRERQQAQVDQERRTLEDRLNARLAEAEKGITATKDAAMSNVRNIAGDAAKAIVERLIGKAPDDRAVDAALADVLKR